MVRAKSYRSPRYINLRTNQISPRSLFTCIDEIYSTAPVFQQPNPSHSSSSQKSICNQIIKNNENCPKWLLIIIIILCIITIIVLLAVYLTH